jgi:6-phosphogluconolactonase
MEALRIVTPAHPAASNFSWQGFNSQPELAEDLAFNVLRELQTAINEKGLAVIAFSGGSTPLALFRSLVRQQWDWSNVVITLVDERWVDQSNPLSNAEFIKVHLLDKLQGKPRFVSLYRDEFKLACNDDARELVLSDYCSATNSSPVALAKFDVAILGMGDDGHTASYFPDADNITDLLNPDNQQPLQCCHSQSSCVQRITWSLAILLNSAYLALHIVGSNKLNVFNRALESQNTLQMPIRTMLFQSANQLQVFYAD